MRTRIHIKRVESQNYESVPENPSPWNICVTFRCIIQVASVNWMTTNNVLLTSGYLDAAITMGHRLTRVITPPRNDLYTQTDTHKRAHPQSICFVYHDVFCSIHRMEPDQLNWMVIKKYFHHQSNYVSIFFSAFYHSKMVRNLKIHLI